MQIDLDTLMSIAALLITMVIGWAIGNAQYVKMKESLDKFSQLVNEVNAALYDDKITEEEFRRIWEKAKGFYEAIRD